MAYKVILFALIVCWTVPNGQFEVMTYTPEEQNDSTIDTVVMMRKAKVVLHPPYNITFFLITSTDAVIGWSPPDVYTMHDVNTTLIDPPFNTTMEWLGKTYPQPDSSSADVKPATAPEDSTMTVETATSETVNKSQVATKTHEELCQSLEYFANYTVDVNLTKEALEDYLPHLITMKEVFRPRNITADMLHKPIVPFAQGCVKEYRVYYQAEQSEVLNVTVNASSTPEIHLKLLKPNTNYTIFVEAVFISDRTLASASASFITSPGSEDKPYSKCLCDWHGTVSRDGLCNSNLSQPCNCREGYQGLFCEQCSPGYYRTAPYFPCHRCPCASHMTRVSTCRFREGFLTCDQCEVGYTGNICHMCDYGYYRHEKFCVPCNCHTNHNRSSPFMCDVITGACHCMFNASGMNCEMCHMGYVGDAIHFKNCTLEDKGQGVFKVLSQGVIACICVGAILLISFIVGCVVYWRMNKNPPHRPFWTVELKDDHEGVNFNTVPNDDFQIADPKTTMDDMEFYEQQGGAAQSRSGGSSSQKYAKLQEHV